MQHGFSKTLKEKINWKVLKCFAYEYKTATNLGKSYLLPKIYKRLLNVPGRRVLLNCGTLTQDLIKMASFV